MPSRPARSTPRWPAAARPRGLPARRLRGDRRRRAVPAASASSTDGVGHGRPPAGEHLRAAHTTAQSDANSSRTARRAGTTSTAEIVGVEDAARRSRGRRAGGRGSARPAPTARPTRRRPLQSRDEQLDELHAGDHPRTRRPRHARCVRARRPRRCRRRSRRSATDQPERAPDGREATPVRRAGRRLRLRASRGSWSCGGGYDAAGARALRQRALYRVFSVDSTTCPAESYAGARTDRDPGWHVRPGARRPPHGRLAARHQLGLDRVLVVVARDPWQDRRRVIAPADIRYEMVVATPTVWRASRRRGSSSTAAGRPTRSTRSYPSVSGRDSSSSSAATSRPDRPTWHRVDELRGSSRSRSSIGRTCRFRRRAGWRVAGGCRLPRLELSSDRPAPTRSRRGSRSTSWSRRRRGRILRGHRGRCPARGTGGA